MTDKEKSEVSTTIPKQDNFWFNNYSILYRRDRLAEFVPKPTQSLSENLNALVRFCAYAGIGLFGYTKKISYLYLPLLSMLATKLMWDYVHSDQERSSIGVKEEMSTLDTSKNPRTIASGQVCVAPTDDNPFMNVSLADYKNDPQRPSACPFSDDKIKENATAKFYNDLFRDVNDVFGRTNSARQFYSMPSTTIPNEQEKFLEFCYGDMMKPGCKQGNMQNCISEDLRQNRRPPQLDSHQLKYSMF